MANVNDNAKECASQCAKIRAWLEEGYSITSLEALRMFGCMRLASRINDLRNRGMEITTCRIKTNTGKTVVEYSMKK